MVPDLWSEIYAVNATLIYLYPGRLLLSSKYYAYGSLREYVFSNGYERKPSNLFEMTKTKLLNN